MAALTARVQTEVLVDHGAFDLLDDGGPQRAVVNWASPSEWLCTGDNAVTILSASGRTHVAEVTVEAWDAVPPTAPGWPAERTATLRLDSGLVEINPLVEGEDTEYLAVGPPGRYHVRAYAAGRDEIVQLDPPPEVELRGIEKYLFQFWPEASG
jgi:hypothetical protein